MLTTSQIVSFTLLALTLTLLPGADTALVLRTSLARSPRAGFIAGTGICSGLLVWGAFASLGLAALIAASPDAYRALRYLGAAYLIYLGVRAFLSTREPEANSRGLASPFLAGLMTNLLNPKVGVFYLSVIPQFVPAGPNALGRSLLLAAIHAVLGLIWWAVIALLMTRSAHLLTPRVRKTMERSCAVALVGFGIRVAI
jgi:threonine/homoserine/homoserine lactone efflux protein